MDRQFGRADVAAKGCQQHQCSKLLHSLTSWSPTHRGVSAGWWWWRWCPAVWKDPHIMWMCPLCSWDDSSSVSSGISDTVDTDDINTSSSFSSYANTPAATRKALDGQVSHAMLFPRLSQSVLLSVATILADMTKAVHLMGKMLLLLGAQLEVTNVQTQRNSIAVSTNIFTWLINLKVRCVILNNSRLKQSFCSWWHFNTLKAETTALLGFAGCVCIQPIPSLVLW